MKNYSCFVCFESLCTATELYKLYVLMLLLVTNNGIIILKCDQLMLNTRKLKAISLFVGVGGCSQGFHEACVEKQALLII